MHQWRAGKGPSAKRVMEGNHSRALTVVAKEAIGCEIGYATNNSSINLLLSVS